MFRFYSPLALIAIALATIAFPSSAEAGHRHHRGSQSCCAQGHSGHGHVGHRGHAQHHMGYQAAMPSYQQPVYQQPMYQPVYSTPSNVSSSCCGQSSSTMAAPMSSPYPMSR